MNNIKATKAINEQELKLGIKASWHDDYKDSAYIYVGGLDPGLTEGDIITIFSQYGEPVDINLPKEKPPTTTTADHSSTNNQPSRSTHHENKKKKSRGFCFLMYENQLSTNLAVDNLNGAVVLGRTLRVDHCKNYKQLERNQDGKMVERDGDLGERLNARPELHVKNIKEEEEDGGGGKKSDGGDSIDPEDPMAGYLREQRRKRRHNKSDGGLKLSRKHDHETEEERLARKKAKRLKKALKSTHHHSSKTPHT